MFMEHGLYTYRLSVCFNVLMSFNHFSFGPAYCIASRDLIVNINLLHLSLSSQIFLLFN